VANTLRAQKLSLGEAQLCLLFTPSMCTHFEPLELLEQVLPYVDLLQLRIKAPGRGSNARELFEWGERLLEFLATRLDSAPPLVINDRIDVAACLMPKGLAGVHLGQADAPTALARQLLGDEAIVGRSTHTARDVVAAHEEAIDYLGFGPIHATQTKGYEQGLGAQAAWIAANASTLPIFPIGGIDPCNAAELAPVGRAAVCGAILAAEDPAQVASELGAALSG